MFFSVDGSLAAVQKQFATMRALPEQFGTELFVARPAVSSWSAGEHLDHTIKVALAFLEQIRKDEPGDWPGVNWSGRLVLTLGWIPRGKARAPERVRGAVCEVGVLDSTIARVESLLVQLRTSPPKERRLPLAKHPYFRGLNAAESARMVEVHTRHHLKIVDEIGRAGARRVTV